MNILTINKWSIGVSITAVVVVVLLNTLAAIDSSSQLSNEQYNHSKAKAPNQQLSGAQKQQIKQITSSESEQIPDQVLATLPLSLQGAPLPSTLAVHDDGSLVINIAVRQYFDYFLTAIGEEPLTLIVERVKHQLAQQLEQPALGTALDIFASYLAYRDELAEILHSGEQSYSNLRAQIRASRDSHFDGLIIEAFFAKEDSYDEFMHKRSTLNSDTSLSAQQKLNRAEQLLANAPQWIQEQHQKANQLNDYYQAINKLNNAGADEVQIQQFREQTFGVEAADRLAALAEKRKIWQQKLTAYHLQLDELLAAKLDKEMLNTELSLLRQQYFTDSEVIRVQAIDSNRVVTINH